MFKLCQAMNVITSQSTTNCATKSNDNNLISCHFIQLLSRCQCLILTHSDGFLCGGINFIFDQQHDFSYQLSKCLITIVQICNTKHNTTHIIISVNININHLSQWPLVLLTVLSATLSLTLKLLVSFHFACFVSSTETLFSICFRTPLQFVGEVCIPFCNTGLVWSR